MASAAPPSSSLWTTSTPRWASLPPSRTTGMPAPMTGSRSSAWVWNTAKASPSTWRAIICSIAACSARLTPSVLLMIWS